MAAFLLSEGATPEVVSAALRRCVKECHYPVRIHDIAQRCAGMEVPQIEAEMRAAWDTVRKFVERYVGADTEGNYHPDNGSWGRVRIGGHEQQPRYPVLPARMLDTVRRTGGWRQHKLMTEDDEPFLQKRFFEEYKAWTATEPILANMKALIEPQQLKQLATSKAMPALPAPAHSAPIARMTEPAPRKDPKAEKARLAAHLKKNPQIGAKA